MRLYINCGQTSGPFYSSSIHSKEKNPKQPFASHSSGAEVCYLGQTWAAEINDGCVAAPLMLKGNMWLPQMEASFADSVLG